MKLQNVSTLVLIRHGESVRNIAEKSGPFFENYEARKKFGRVRDRLIPLTSNGVGQARKAGRGLKRLFGVPDWLFHSGFVRTRQTTDGILSAYSKKELLRTRIRENRLIRERDAGYFSDFTQKEIQELFPWWNNYWHNHDRFLTVPFGGESIVSVCEGRLLTFLKLLEDFSYKKGGKKIFLVSHGRAILGMRYLLEDWSYEKMNDALANENLLNCSVTYYLFDPYGRPHLQFANRILR